jgi:hypothetical protein
VTTSLIHHHGPLHLAISYFCYHQQPKGLKSSDRIGPQQPLQPKKVVPEGELEKLAVFGLSQLFGNISGQRVWLDAA